MPKIEKGKDLKLQIKLYRLLLEKYADIINEGEKRTIGEIKSLINGEDLTIQAILSDFMPEKYSFEKDYAKTAPPVLNFITSEIEYVDHELNLNYWLTPKEIFTSKVGDDEDLAVFLCSLLLGLGDEKAEVVIAELDNLKTHAFVITELENKFYLLDPSQKTKFNEFSGNKEDVVAKYSFTKAKIKRFLYKFNHSNYEQFL